MVKVGVMMMAEEISFSELYVTKALGRHAQQPTRRYHFSITINYVASGPFLFCPPRDPFRAGRACIPPNPEQPQLQSRSRGRVAVTVH